MSEPVSFRINGETCSMALNRDTPLIYVLRNDLKLTGTRLGCGGGECGCCSVLMDGRRVRSCETPLWGVAGKEITTIEGLSRDGELHPLQQAFIDEQAAQCGYCVNGIIIAAASLLASDASATEAEIRKHLDQNLCRCGVHERMVRAVLRAAKAMNVKRSTSP